MTEFITKTCVGCKGAKKRICNQCQNTKQNNSSNCLGCESTGYVVCWNCEGIGTQKHYLYVRVDDDCQISENPFTEFPPKYLHKTVFIKGSRGYGDKYTAHFHTQSPRFYMIHGMDGRIEGFDCWAKYWNESKNFTFTINIKWLDDPIDDPIEIQRHLNAALSSANNGEKALNESRLQDQLPDAIELDELINTRKL